MFVCHRVHNFLMLTRKIVLQDPSVANAPVEKRIAFLESKNLTQEEVHAALARASQIGGGASAAGPVSGGYGPPQQQQAGPYGPPPYGYWQQPPPEYVIPVERFRVMAMLTIHLESLGEIGAIGSSWLP
jgi:hypothetical protein